jgi:hypothetical protein
MVSWWTPYVKAKMQRDKKNADSGNDQLITNRVDFQEWAWHQPLKAAPIFILIIGCGGGGNGNSSRPDEGASDPTPALTWYPDIDKDGLGDFSDASEAAQRPDGYVSDHSDCQDLDPTIHPNATDICGDDIDQDFSCIELGDMVARNKGVGLARG